ncbi:hypothetical protein [Herbaspirillum sp. 1130]|uniref:hypothetical protein n=1 Tax=Herbaspirillum sp. 1130 TaxID=2806562 RepID=UPI001AE98112|nr:hypothetical protein [Herbaspirillum sp. 1130]MBP1314443.1 hypothetical protein [Herbaspirillum sp. 1130]
MDVKVIALQSLMHGRLDLRKGQEATIPEAVAAELERASLVKRVASEPVVPAAPAKGGTAPARTGRAKKETPSAAGSQPPAPVGETKLNAPPAGASAGNLADGAQVGEGGQQGEVVQTSAQGADGTKGDQVPSAGAESDAGNGGGAED